MPTSLRPKEETQYDDTRPGTQPNEAFDNIARMYDEPAYTNDRDPANKRARSPEDLRNAEANPRSSQDKPGLMEAKSLGEAAKLIPQGYIPGGAGGVATKAFLKYFGSKNRKQGLIWGSITGVAITIALVGASFSSGPLQMIHAGQLMTDAFWAETEEIGDNSSARGMRSSLLRGRTNAESLRVNIVTASWLNKVDARLEKSGIKPTFKGEFRYGTGYDVDLSKRTDILRVANTSGAASTSDGLTPEQRAAQKLLGMSAADAKKFNVSRIGDTLRIEMPSDYKSARYLNKFALKSIGYNNGTAFILSMSLTKRAGVFNVMHPIQNLRKSAETKIDAAIDKWKTDRRKTILVNDAAVNVQAKPQDDDFKNSDGTRAADADIANKNDSIEDINKLGLTAVDAAKASPSIFIAALCVANAVSRNYDKLQHINVVIPAVIMAHELVSVGTQIRAGVAISNTVKNEAGDLLLALGLFDSLFNNSQTDSTGRTKTKKGFWENPVMQALNNTPVSSNIETPEELLGVGQKDEMLKSPIIASGFSSNTCTFMGSPLGIFAQIAGEVLLFKGAGSLLARTTNAVGGEIVESATVDPLMNGLVKWILGSIAGQVIDPNAGGAVDAAVRIHGMLFGKNIKNASFGATGTLSRPQQISWAKFNREVLVQEQANKSIADRVLNPLDAYSLAGRTLRQVDPSVRTNVSNIANSFMNISRTFASLGANVFKSKSAYAYGGISDAMMAEYINFPVSYGMPLEEMQDDTYNFYGDNNRVLTAIVSDLLNDEENGAALRDKIKRCTGNKVIEATDGNWTIWTAPPYEGDDPDFSNNLSGVNIIDMYGTDIYSDSGGTYAELGCGSDSELTKYDAGAVFGAATTIDMGDGSVLAATSISGWKAIQGWIAADITSNQGNCAENQDEESCALVGAAGTPPSVIAAAAAAESSSGDTSASYIESGWAWPSPSGRITTYHGAPRTYGPHKGIDISQRGNALALHDGTITKIYDQIRLVKDGVSYGNCPLGMTGTCLLLSWADSEGTWEAYYNHQGALSNIKVGTAVKVGDPISYYNDTGISTGPHIHLQMYKNGELIDPLTTKLKDLVP